VRHWLGRALRAAHRRAVLPAPARRRGRCWHRRDPSDDERHRHRQGPASTTVGLRDFDVWTAVRTLSGLDHSLAELPYSAGSAGTITDQLSSPGA